jgi:hypothetical protein
MDSVLSSLGTLINNIKNLTLPGLVAALAFAILLWTPQPIDVVTDAGVNPPYKENWPTTKSGFAALANLERRAKAGKAGEDEPVAWKNEDFGPVCWTKTVVLRQPQGLSEKKPVAVVNQYELERIQRQLQDCADRETALSGAEQGLILDNNRRTWRSDRRAGWHSRHLFRLRKKRESLARGIFKGAAGKGRRHQG